MFISFMRQQFNVATERLNVSFGCNDRDTEYRTTEVGFLIVAGQTPSRIFTNSGYITR